MADSPAIALTGLSLTYRSPGRDVAALADLHAIIPAASIVGLVGRNGAGKTTLLRVLAGREPRFTGDAHVHRVPLADLGRTPGLVHLAGAGWPGAGDRRLASLIAGLGRARPHFDRTRALALLEGFGIHPSAHPRRLSAGKQTAAQASLALASRAPLTLLDEPQTGLDAPSRDLLTRAIIEEQALRPRTWVISTHLIDETAPLFERVLVLDAGRLVTDADVDELLTRWVRVEADLATLEALPRLGELERLGGRGSAIVAASDVPAGFAGRTHPLTLQALAGVLPLASKE